VAVVVDLAELQPQTACRLPERTRSVTGPETEREGAPEIKGEPSLFLLTLRASNSPNTARRTGKGASSASLLADFLVSVPALFGLESRPYALTY
jgi:hypothetical protein